MSRYILIKPLISEKAEGLSEKRNQFTFVVDKKANKVEIGKAVEKMYSVNVLSVNTAVIPGKKKTRFTKAGVAKGMKPSYKKAIITVADGETIDFYGEA
ncbi:MAG: 50S ribosomal protein L23 [Saprospiraceae bacterium]|jgi:large subunit ribosomal protein L23|nr:50S ribosomal protein L23 [Saprospiraceae bacterium]